MKNTLFLTMMAAALLGGQAFAWPVVVYRVSDLPEGEHVAFSESEAALIVDAQKTLQYVEARLTPCFTLDYQGEFVLTTNLILQTPDYGVFNITSTIPTVATAWKDAFSAAEGGSITLCSSDEGIDNVHGPVQFLGKDADSTVKLGNTEVLYKGVVNALSDLAMNQVGVVWGSNDITLVGKVEKSVPEPATGTFSLLALAGLCARRRRK